MHGAVIQWAIRPLDRCPFWKGTGTGAGEGRTVNTSIACRRLLTPIHLLCSPEFHEHIHLDGSRAGEKTGKQRVCEHCWGEEIEESWQLLLLDAESQRPIVRRGTTKCTPWIKHQLWAKNQLSRRCLNRLWARRRNIVLDDVIVVGNRMRWRALNNWWVMRRCRGRNLMQSLRWRPYSGDPARSIKLATLTCSILETEVALPMNQNPMTKRTSFAESTRLSRIYLPESSHWNNIICCVWRRFTNLPEFYDSNTVSRGV